MAGKNPHDPGEAPLSRRERQLMDIVYRRREASAREILGDLDDAPGYSTVRTQLSLLVKKGHLLCATKDRTHYYRPARKRTTAATAAMRRLVRTFFDGSVANAVTGLLSMRDHRLTPEELERIGSLISESRKEPP